MITVVLGCIPSDQSESGFFNRKLDRIADQLEHKIQKWICFHTEVPGLRLPWDFWSAVHAIKQSWHGTNVIDKSIDHMEWTIQNQFKIPIWMICLWKWIIWIATKVHVRSDCSEMEWKIYFSIEESRFKLVKRNATLVLVTTATCLATWIGFPKFSSEWQGRGGLGSSILCSTCQYANQSTESTPTFTPPTLVSGSSLDLVSRG